MTFVKLFLELINPFLKNERKDRRSYFLAYWFRTITFIWVSLLLYLFYNISWKQEILYFIIFPYLLYLWSMISLVISRFSDLNQSRLRIFFFMIPLIGLFIYLNLFLHKWSSWKNDYWEPYHRSHQKYIRWYYVIASIGLILSWIGPLLPIIITLYQKHYI